MKTYKYITGIFALLLGLTACENENYMKYDKTTKDIKRYMRSSRLAPNGGECPHEKICEECNFNELCLNYYLDKEVDE